LEQNTNAMNHYYIVEVKSLSLRVTNFKLDIEYNNKNIVILIDETNFYGIINGCFAMNTKIKVYKIQNTIFIKITVFTFYVFKKLFLTPLLTTNSNKYYIIYQYFLLTTIIWQRWGLQLCFNMEQEIKNIDLILLERLLYHDDDDPLLSMRASLIC
jgi:hypothetical protein